MKKSLLICLLTLVFAVSSGCNASTPNKQNDDTQKPTNVEQNKESINPNKQAIDSSSVEKNYLKGDNTETANERYFGTWIINRDITSGQASTYSKADIEKLLGKTITYSADLVSFFDNECKNPHYKKVTVSEDKFFEDFYVSFNRLGIKTKSIDFIDVYTDKESKEHWESVGSTFMVKDNDTLILFDNGEFFEVARLK